MLTPISSGGPVDATRALYRRHAASPEWRTADITLARAQGATVEAADGRHFIDLASGGFGAGHPAVRRAVAAQVRKGPLSSRLLVNRPLTELVTRLAELAPGSLSVSYVCNSGEEALDSALKLAKGHAPQRTTVVVGQGGDYGSLSHGQHLAGGTGTLLAGLPLQARPLPLGETARWIEAIGPDTAAVLVEPLSLGQGALEAPAGFWQALRARCTATGALLIVSELRTGLGRCGSLFAVEQTGVEPDVLVLGPGLDGGCVPIGVYVTRKAINDRVYGRRNPSLHGSTTGGNPACCVAALAALEAIESEGLVQRHRRLGVHLRLVLAGHAGRTGTGLVRVQQCGTLATVDFCSAQRAQQVWQAAWARGVRLRPPQGERLLLQAPLTLTQAELDLALARWAQALDDVPPADLGAVSGRPGATQEVPA